MKRTESSVTNIWESGTQQEGIPGFIWHWNNLNWGSSVERTYVFEREVHLRHLGFSSKSMERGGDQGEVSLSRLLVTDDKTFFLSSLSNPFGKLSLERTYPLKKLSISSLGMRLSSIVNQNEIDWNSERKVRIVDFGGGRKHAVLAHRYLKKIRSVVNCQWSTNAAELKIMKQGFKSD